MPTLGEWYREEVRTSRLPPGHDHGKMGVMEAPGLPSPEGHTMAYDPSGYEERQAANDRSRTWATRDGMTWTATDDAVILQDWVYRGASHRDETQVSRDLQRTIEACRNRAHYLRGVHTGVRYNKQPERSAAICTGCWIELPASGVCTHCRVS